MKRVVFKELSPLHRLQGPTSTMAPLRLLCLHGQGMNANIFRAQTGIFSHLFPAFLPDQGLVPFSSPFEVCFDPFLSLVLFLL